MGQNDDDSKKANELDEATLNIVLEECQLCQSKTKTLGNMFKT